MRIITRTKFRIAEKRFGTAKNKKEVRFPCTSSIYVYQRWEWLIVASFPYLVVLITSPLPPLLHISLGFTFNPLYIYRLDIIIQIRLPFILINQHYDQTFLIF